MRAIIVIFLFSCFSLFSFSQKAPAKFGDIPLSELEMKVYDKDTSAAAVVLWEYGIFSSTGLKFSHLVRIKILKKEGTSWGNWVFPNTVKGYIKGNTYNLENGEVTKEALKNSSIMTENITGPFVNLRVAMPNVKVGSVVELEFTFDGIPFEWRFQKPIPVMYSELLIEYSTLFTFRKNFFGYEPLSLVENNRWIAKDMPSFKEEPYMNSSENYVTKLEFDYSNYQTTWEEVCKIISKQYFFTSNSFLNDVTTSIKSMNLTDEKKIEAAFDSVKIIKWNKIQRWSPTNSNLAITYKQKLGSAADINLILLQLLKKLDIKSYPVVLSTRQNGVLSPATASLVKLNHIIVYAEADGKTFLLDPTEEYMPYNLLPEKCLNWQGRIIKGEESFWIDLQATKKNKEMTIYNLQLTEDMNLEGKINNIRYDYAASDFRKQYFSFNGKDEFLNDFLKNKTGLEILESEFTNLENIKIPMEDKYSVVISNKIDQIGDEFYLYPLLYEQITENPFLTEDRKYPVDFAYKQEKTVIVNITIPDNFEIIELPESVKMKMPGNEGYYYYQVSINNSQLTINYKFAFDQVIILPEQYPDLKEFYNQIITKHSQPVILKKKNEL